MSMSHWLLMTDEMRYSCTVPLARTKVDFFNSSLMATKRCK
jgi:hypothetical protein